MSEPICDGDVCHLPSKERDDDELENSDDDKPLGLQVPGALFHGILPLLLNGGLVDHEGVAASPSLPLYSASADERPLIGIYFSASWCPPCQQFSPILKAFAQKNRTVFQVVLVSLDTDPDAAAEYISTKNSWLAVPWSHSERRKSLASRVGVQMIPQLTIVDSNSGEIVSSWGRSAIMKNADNCLQEWREGGSGVSWWQLVCPW
ncbi:thioredoxin-like-domain-containing protein [Syncephalis fuscata]|nr:thioredoxin-like-domain-containing protein [Syncephalis fuscata]